MKFLYYLIQWTWGLLMNIIGGITCLVCLCCKCPVQKYRNAVEILVPWNFGGLELGMFFVRGEKNPSVAPHEYGHTIQNLWWGPLFPFIISIPSAIRYWLRKRQTEQKKKAFATIIFAIAVIVGVALAFIPHILFIGLSIALYACIVYCWLIIIEIPKYNKGNIPYDSIWFEGQATALGEAATANKWKWL